MKSISHFYSNKYNGTLFIFENEIVELLGKSLYEYSPVKFITNQVEIAMLIFSKTLREGEKEIVNDILIDKISIEDAAKKYGFTTSRIKVVFERGIRRIKRSIRMSLDYEELKSKISDLYSTKYYLEKEVFRLKSLIPDSNIKNPYFNLKIIDMDLSVRAINCLKAADVNTLGDLSTVYKKDLSRFRNMGKRSLKEIIELMNQYSIGFAKKKIDNL